MTAESTLQRPAVASLPTGRHRREHSTAAGLFGRGMVYVVVWSLQLLVASLVSPVLAHLLIPQQFGYLSTSIALYQLFTVLMVFGLDQALVMEYSDGGFRRSHAARIVWLAGALAAFLTAALYLTGPVWAPAAGFPGFGGIVTLAVLWSGPGAVNIVVMALLRAQDRLAAFVLVNLIAGIGGQVGGVLVLLSGHRSATAYGWAGVGAQCMALIVGVVLARVRPGGLVDRVWAGRVLRAGAALAASAFAMFLLNTGDRVLLQRMDGAESVGRYQIAYVVGSVPILLLAFLNQSWLPRILEIDDRRRQWRVLARSRDMLVGVVAPAVAALIVFAPVALRVLAPASYGVNSLLSVVFWVAVAAFPVADCAATTRALVALRRTGSVAVATGLAAALNVVLNLALIPSLHVTGAALATFVAYAAQALCARALLRRHGPLAAPGRPAWTSVAGATIVALAAVIPLPVSAATLAGRSCVAVLLLAVALRRLVRARSAEL